jgi:hypothetical protein
MTFAGKKLQDIYDAGADRLAEVEQEALNKLKQAKENHSERLKTDVKACIGRVEETAADLKSELGIYIEGSLERLKNVIEAETRETKAQSLYLVTELTNLSEKLRASIATLKKVYEENLDHVSVTATDKYMSTVERAKMELGKHEYASSRHLKAHGTFVANSLQQKLDHVLWESRGDEKQVTGSLFKSYMQKANAIDSHFSALMQKFSSEFQSQYKTLEGAAKTSESEVDTAAKANLQKIDDYAAKIENQVSEHFKKLSEQHRQKLDGDLAVVADDLSRLHDTTTEKLGENTEQLGESLLGASAQAQETLKGRCDDMKEKVDASMAEFTRRLQERIKTSTDLKSLLESDRDEIVGGIRVELAHIRDAFEKKVVSLIAVSSERVKNIAGEAEREIHAAQKSCDEQLTAEGLATKTEIDSEVTKFIDGLGRHRVSALDEITKAAGTEAASAGSEESTSSKGAKKGTKE